MLTIKVISIHPIKTKEQPADILTEQLNEEEFDNHVAAGIKRVAALLENAENIQVSRFANGYSIKQFEEDTNGNFQYQQQTSSLFDKMSLFNQQDIRCQRWPSNNTNVERTRTDSQACIVHRPVRPCAETAREEEW